MYCTISPISSIWPSSIIVGDPLGLTSAMLLPATSLVTFSAKVDASSRQTRAAGPSNPDGPGVSSRRLRKASEDGLNINRGGRVLAGSDQEILARDGMGWKRRVSRGCRLLRASNRKSEKAQSKNDQSGDIPPQVFGQSVIENSKPRQHLAEQPAVQAVGNSGRLPPAARPAAVVEAQIDHLHQGVQPGQHAYPTQLPHDDGLREV